MHLGRRYDGQLHSRLGDTTLSLPLRLLEKRKDQHENDGNGDETNSNVAVAVASVVAGLLAGVFVVFLVLRMLRSAGFEPTYIPSHYLKRKWRNWEPRRTYNQVPRETRYNTDHHDTAYRGRHDNQSPSGIDEEDIADGGAAGVGRNTSVRSVMTLPAYSPSPKATEQVIGREGERAGMDMVVEFPETAEEEEARREEQMESLYQIRLARRQEQEEREERRRQRREAREQSDWDRLNELRRERRERARSEASRQSGNSASLSIGDAERATSAALIAEHQSRGRERRIAEVTYAEVGHVRHDGTRLRASSQESDSRPLLDAAASMGGGSGRESPSYVVSRSRGNSAASSVMSMSTANSDFEHLPSATNISNSNPIIPHPRSSSHDITPRNSGDLADATAAPLPPNYDDLQWGDAPAYESPVAERGDRPDLQLPIQQQQRQEQPPQLELPNLSVLPSIEIESATPANSAPNTPATPTMRNAEEQDLADASNSNANTTTVTTGRQS